MNDLAFQRAYRLIWKIATGLCLLLQSTPLELMGAGEKEIVYSADTNPKKSLRLSIMISEAFSTTVILKNIGGNPEEIPAAVERIFTKAQIAQEAFPAGVRIQVKMADGSMASANQVDSEGWFTPLYLVSRAAPATQKSSVKIAPGDSLEVDFSAYSLLYGLDGFLPLSTFPSGASQFRLLFQGVESSGADLVTDWIRISEK